MPLQATSGAASYDAFGGGVPFEPIYIEQVFQNWLYTGNGSTQTVTNGIDLAGKGGLVWTKYRASAVSTTNNILVDTVRGPDQVLVSNNTSAQANVTNATVFGSTGFTMGVGTPNLNNENNATYASWTFRKQPKFFDVVTYTGTGSVQNIAHNLGSTPGCIIIKDYSFGGYNWAVYHRSLGATQRIFLNSTSAAAAGSTVFNDTEPTSTQFTVGTSQTVNLSGAQYVAYVFAHNAGGFGLTGTDNVISCSSFTTDGSGNATVDLGYEPQWLLVKANASGNDWYMYDNMRGLSYSNYVYLSPNLSAAEGNIAADYLVPTATGFKTKSFAGSTTYIYIAIRRGPMKVPTTGTSVFAPVANSLTTNPYTGTTNFPVDMVIARTTTAGYNTVVSDRLRSNSTTNYANLFTNLTNAEGTGSSAGFSYQSNTSFIDNGVVAGNSPNIYWNFRRAPGFFDEVCYTGTGSDRTVAHNLAAVPELMIFKRRSGTAVEWGVYSQTIGAGNYLELNTTIASTASTFNFNNTAPTASVFSLGNASRTNTNTQTYVAYLFASCPGVSKVGSYTGNGSSQTIDCGFTGGARFVLIKRTDSTGDWYVWDTARGIVSGNDPYLRLNTTAAEVTSNDTIDTDSTGFVVNQVSATNVNVSSATYIFLAIA